MGFLISNIIFRGMDARMNGAGEARPFSFIDFYSRRVRRIFPSLIFCLLTFLVLGWFVLLPDEYRLLGKHVTCSGRVTRASQGRDKRAN